jgi:hypothetical protein
MEERQARIFVPNSEPQDGWAETLLGRVVRPLVGKYESNLAWFWFSRYEVPQGIDDGDCDIAQLSDDYRRDVHQYKNVHRSLRFRYCAVDESTSMFENELLNKASSHRYSVPGGPLAWGLCSGLGDDRHVGIENRDDEGRARRATLVVQHYMGTSRLVLDALVGPDGSGHYRLEQNDHGLNPHGSTFESLHHLFCNITAVPTFARVAVNGQQIVEIPVRF